MTTVATRTQVIDNLEGFNIIIRKDGGVVDPKLNGVLGAYGYEKAAKHNMTVSEWKQNRFQVCYPGFTCDVLHADGSIAKGNTSLRTVRESYEDEDEE